MDEQPVAPADDVGNDEVCAHGMGADGARPPAKSVRSCGCLPIRGWHDYPGGAGGVLRSMKDRLPYRLSSRSHALSQPIAIMTNAKTGGR